MNNTIEKGTEVAIMFNGRKIKGTVISARNWGGNDGWYIELTREDGGYGYWKQGPDGGALVEVGGEPYESK